MDRDLEDVESFFHALLWILHSIAVVALTVLHAFASLFFGRRVIREYNRWRPVRWVFLWAAFHLIGATVSFIASKVHARDAKGDHR